MTTNGRQNSIIISKKTVQRKGGVVILDLEEYQKLCERAVPIYYLKGKEAVELDNLVEEGLEEYRAGKTRKVSSLADLD